jgi:hypothetical protein
MQEYKKERTDHNNASIGGLKIPIEGPGIWIGCIDVSGVRDGTGGNVGGHGAKGNAVPSSEFTEISRIAPAEKFSNPTDPFAELERDELQRQHTSIGICQYHYQGLSFSALWIWRCSAFQPNKNVDVIRHKCTVHIYVPENSIFSQQRNSGLHFRTNWVQPSI